MPSKFPHSEGRTTQSLWTQRKQLTMEDGILYRVWEDVDGGGQHKRLQLIIPRKLVEGILREVHNTPTGGHLGVTKVLGKIRERFYWVGQRRDVEDWCRNCDVCASRKSPQQHRRAPMQIVTSGSPMQRVAMDIMGPFPETARRNKYILVIGDYFTKWMEAYPMENMEAVTVARIFVNEFVSRYGAPEFLHTDQGRNFESNLMKEVCQVLGIMKTRTTPFHPQSDGLVERFNRTLLQMLSTAVIDHEEDWDLQLPLLMLAYRSSIQESTKVTPFSLMFGREVCLPIDVMYGTPCEQSSSTSEFSQSLRSRLDKSYSRVREHMKIAQQRQKTLYDHRKQGAPYNVGDRVWLHVSVVPRGASRKLHRPWKGPYKVVKIINDVVYRVQKEDTPRKRVVVHFDRLKPFFSKPVVESEIIPLLPVQENDQTTNEQGNAESGSSGMEPASNSPPQLRRSTRSRNPPERYGDPILY